MTERILCPLKNKGEICVIKRCLTSPKYPRCMEEAETVARLSYATAGYIQRLKGNAEEVRALTKNAQEEQAQFEKRKQNQAVENLGVDPDLFRKAVKKHLAKLES